MIRTWMMILAVMAASGAASSTLADEWSDRIDEAIEELQPTADERKVDQIGWARSILEARDLAREHDRPVFLFTLDGRMDTGRC
jgi:hypothetical protein